MRIGHLAQESGLTTKTLRYYESIGILPAPKRQSNGYRDFERGALERLAFVKDAQAAGLTLPEVGLVLDMRDRGERTCSHVIGLLEKRLGDLDRQIETMGRARERLEHLIARADLLDPANCSDPNRCQTIAPTHEHALTGAHDGGHK